MSIDGEVYNVSGTIYEDCDKSPLANQKIQLLHITSSGSCQDQDIITETDNKGNFTFTYQNTCENFLLSDEYLIKTIEGKMPGAILYTRIPGKTSVNLNEFYAYRKLYVPLDIYGSPKVNDYDTLFVGISATDFVYFHPILPVDTTLEFSPAPYIYKNKLATSKLYYCLGRANYQKSFTDAYMQSNSVSFNDRGCYSSVDTIRIPIN